MSILHPKWSLSHIPAANSLGSDPALLSLVWTVEADTFICPGLSSLRTTHEGRQSWHPRPTPPDSLIAYCPAEGKGKGHVGLRTIPPWDSLLSMLGAGTTSHVTSKRQDSETEMPGFHCSSSPGEKALIRCLVLGMGDGGRPYPKV